MKKILLFDFDDTLCMTEEICFHTENSILAKMGHPPMSRAIHQTSWGMKLGEALPLRAPNVNVSDFLKHFQQMVAENVGVADTIPTNNLITLEKLKEKGHRLGVLTSRNRLELSGVLNTRHPLTTLMEGFYYLENCTHHKPDPRVFDNALRDFNSTTNEVVYIGDSIGDAMAAKSAGMTFVASLESGIRSKADFNQAGTDFFIHHLEELLELEF